MHNVAVTGEKGSSDEQGASKFISELMTHLLDCNYLPKAILQILLNVDECGLQWKSLPQQTYKREGTVFKAKKEIKDRLTIMVGTAMDVFKLTPLVIGKAQNPRAFKGIDTHILPVHYYWHDTA